MTATDITHSADRGFRMRGDQVTRVEALSDVVFGFALTLLGVSLGMPRTFDQLLEGIRDFPAFAICFAILIRIWHEHYRFFRRYGLQDGRIIFLNSILLFIVILFVYCLKFIISLWVTVLTTSGNPITRMPDGKLVLIIRFAQTEWLMFIFGIGFAVIYAVFALLFVHAFELRDRLHLNPLEAFETREGIIRNLLVCSVGLILSSASLVLGGLSSRWSALAFTLIPVFLIVRNSIAKRSRERLMAQSENEMREPAILDEARQ
jgi:hypothetical protein